MRGQAGEGAGLKDMGTEVTFKDYFPFVCFEQKNGIRNGMSGGPEKENRERKRGEETREKRTGKINSLFWHF